MVDFLTTLKSQALLADGAMGSYLFNLTGRLSESNHVYEAFNVEQPDLIEQVHLAYLVAGARCLKTNTFGANRFKLSKHGLDQKIIEINKAGVELAKRVAEASFKDVLIAGDVGPLGVRIAPFGRVQPEQARRAFAEQIEVLCESGADLIVIETMTDLYEIQEAIKAAKQVCSLPLVASITFTRDDRTLLGDDPMKVARTLNESGADVIGVNCSGGPAQLLRIIKQMRQAVPDGKFWVKPNAGWPEQVGGRACHPHRL